LTVKPKPKPVPETAHKRWVITHRSTEYATYASEEMAIRQFHRLRGSKLGPEIKLLRPDGSEY
jgi:hypothetical protein